MIPSHVRIFLCSQPMDMRRSFDALALAAKRATGWDPTQGSALFCFVNKRRTHLKVLWFDQGGYCILYRRLHGRRFELLEHEKEAPAALPIERSRFAALLRGVERHISASRVLH